MVHAKNYETMSKFVTVMPRNTVASFFWTQCILGALHLVPRLDRTQYGLCPYIGWPLAIRPTPASSGSAQTFQ